jgi:ankyrin repeat protein
MRLLLDAGADPQAKDDNGKTPLDLARDAKHEEMIRLLEAVPAQ